MLKHLAGVSMIALSTPALAASSDAVYELTVIIDTVQTPALCDLEHNICINGQPPAFTEGPVPYRFATLKITHDALTKHNARLSDMTNPPTNDGRITSFTLASLPGIDGGEAPGYLTIPAADPYCPAGYPDRLFESIPPCSYINHLRIDGEGYALDLSPIIENRLAGTIDISDAQEHGVGCDLHMMGANDVWTGTWSCFSEGGTVGSTHTFTAKSRRVDREHVAER